MMILTPAEIAKYQRVTDSKCADCGLGCHDEGCIWTWITALLADREELEGKLAQAYQVALDATRQDPYAHGWLDGALETQQDYEKQLAALAYRAGLERGEG